MGWIQRLGSLFGGSERRRGKKDAVWGECIAKSVFYSYLDAQRAIIMFYSLKEGWVGGNLAFYETFGFEDIEAFRRRYRRIGDFFGDETFEIFADNDGLWLQQLERDRLQTSHVRMTLPDGSGAVFALRAKQFKSGADGLYFLEMTDVTDQIAARREREEAEAAKSKFLSNISHEFRTPMNGIMGFLELLKQSHPSATQSEYIRMIDRSSRHMMTTIESLLDLAQMQSGRLSLAVSEFRPVAEFEAMFDHFYPEAKQRGVHLNIFIDPKLPTYIEADQRKLRQVLNQLLDNAIKFTEEGGRVQAEIRVLKKREDDRFEIGFSIKDTGIGIEPAKLATITQPFESGEHSDNRLGVGLSLTVGLLEMMGSTLKITSERQRGSHFSFVLEVTGTTVSSFDPLKNRRAQVALFDDALASEANLLSRYLQAFGIQVTKVHHSQPLECEEEDLLYIVAPRDNSGWLMELGASTRSCRVVMLAEEDEAVPERVRQLVDYTLRAPLKPGRISRHLTQIFHLPSRSDRPLPKVSDKVKVLIVEDNIINQRLIKLLLQEYNLSVTTADNGHEAVELCRKYPYDIIFMDIDMPVKDGIVATHEIRRLSRFKRSPAPIIALTALAMQGDRERILSEGLDDYISKPLGREKLETILEKHLKMTVQP